MPIDGLFLGAGASYEVGMPLVWDLTTQFRDWLTKEHLRDINEEWRRQGHGHSDEVVADVSSILARDDLHYEAVLGHLEVQFRRPSPRQREYHNFYSWLVQAVYSMLYLRHSLNAAKIAHNIRFLEGIARLAHAVHPLWIFSLNHDVLIECVAAEFNIPLSCGFTNTRVKLPRRNAQGQKIGDIDAEVITDADLKQGAMPFLGPSTTGINLLKIRGALDVFTFHDGKDLLRVLPATGGAEGVIDILRATNEELLWVDPTAPQVRIRPTNEIAYEDNAGSVQFLRRTLLAGAFKFDARGQQVLPMPLLGHLKSNINHVSSLACVGYGFGDLHINDVLRNWLEFSADRQIEIVDPRNKGIPSFLLHLAPQVTMTKLGAVEYFDRVGGIVRTRAETLELRLAALNRQLGNDESKRRLEIFMKARSSRSILKSSVRLLAMQLVERIGADPSVVDKYAPWLRTSQEDILEEFLELHEHV